MKYFFRDVAKNFVMSFAAMLGGFLAMGVWNGGLGDKVRRKTRKLFSKIEKGES